MSARDMLVDLLYGERSEELKAENPDVAPSREGDADAIIRVYRREVLREAAEKIRAEPPPADLDNRFGPYINAWLDGQQEAADLIDPDKES